ncbi:non-specific lipid-transfer protein-like protein [Cocos nucifera]|uniref:Non-specific lipid-transfer protein-like protein n=1 Tax=Cocos nucifera TaxID=13894 RepID=A0A8K0I312_COCNU|nr:non-specific lipid-transfer protein-like protein [Cocos nucifera]
MARLVLAICAMAIWAFLVPAAIASDSSPTPPSGCDDVIPDMADCLPYVTDGSNETSPSKGCCTGIAHVVAKSPLCLCEALKEASQLNIAVNMTRALGLSNLCKLNVPPISSCNGTWLMSF